MVDDDFLATTVDVDAGLTILKCGGLDWKHVQAFRAAVAALPRRGGIVLDLRGDRSDAAGTGAIIGAVLDILNGSQPVVLFTGAGIERAVLKSTGLGQFATLVTSLEEARAVFSGVPECSRT